jgi:DNA-binding protein HU-beta
MNQKTLTYSLAHRFSLTYHLSRQILHFMLTQTAEALTKGERVTFQTFGTFQRTTRAAKKVRHPKTGKIITLPAHPTASFRPAPALTKRFH